MAGAADSRTNQETFTAFSNPAAAPGVIGFVGETSAGRIGVYTYDVATAVLRAQPLAEAQFGRLVGYQGSRLKHEVDARGTRALLELFAAAAPLDPESVLARTGAGLATGGGVGHNRHGTSRCVECFIPSRSADSL